MLSPCVRPVLAAAFLLGTACVVPLAVSVSDEQYRRATAGSIGCPSSEIEVSGQKNVITPGDGIAEWRAACRGKRFICTGSKVVTCTEELPVPAATAAAPAQL